jgi:hypothetical protein
VRFITGLSTTASSASKRDYTVILNDGRMSELHSIGWEGGAAEFKANMRDQILLPARRAH